MCNDDLKKTIDGGQKMLSLGGQTLFKKNSSKFNLSKKLLYQKLPGYTAPPISNFDLIPSILNKMSCCVCFNLKFFIFLFLKNPLILIFVVSQYLILVKTRLLYESELIPQLNPIP